MKATDALDTLQELAGSASPEERSAFDRLMKQVEDAGSQRMSWEQLLGASLYEATAADAHFRAGREALYDGIAASDAEIDRCVEEARGIVAELEARRAAERAAAEAPRLAAVEQDEDGPCTCPFCGTTVEARTASAADADVRRPRCVPRSLRAAAPSRRRLRRRPFRPRARGAASPSFRMRSSASPAAATSPRPSPLRRRVCPRAHLPRRRCRHPVLASRAPRMSRMRLRRSLSARAAASPSMTTTCSAWSAARS